MYSIYISKGGNTMSYYVSWDETGERLIETGTKKGMLYPMKADGTDYDDGVAWTGLREVNNQPSGAEETKLWADDIKYMSLRSAEEFGITIGAYMSPVEFDECDGSVRPATAAGVRIGQQKRKTFGFSYVSTLANDTLGYDYGYEIHIIYGLTASPSERSHSSINDSPEGSELSWEASSVPVNMSGYKPTSEIVIEASPAMGLITHNPDGTITKDSKLEALETVLYGTAASQGVTAVKPKLPSPDQVIGIMSGTLEVVDGEIVENP
jgi:hypothetical protein